ncbi:glycosyltransferase family 2 protein [Jiangella alkaliphila]|uniref:glycosyltransferase family 2 protein n=1 Tax=Jiangella alkaliphila TaxID=419479 RepID=UPI00069A6061|nr:glycosyltransferase family A protein [Jiangella alkaliphila]
MAPAAGGVTTAPSDPAPAAAAEKPVDDATRRIRLVRDALRAKSPARTPARPELRVAVAASPRLARALAWEWDQVDLVPEAAGTGLTGAELVLIEVHGGVVPGWGAPAGRASELAASAHDRGLPVLVWVTAGSSDPESAAALMPLAAAVFVADPAATGTWRERWPDAVVEALPPAAAPRSHSPAHGGTGAKRIGDVAAVIDESPLDTAAAVGLERLLVPATERPAVPRPHVWRSRLGKRDGRAEAVLPEAVKEVVAGATVGDLAEPVADHYRVVVDAARCAPDSAWTLVEAGAAQTTVVTLPEYHATLPGDLAEHVGTADESEAFAREIAIRAAQPEFRDREALRLHRAVLAGHTTGQRAEAMLTAIGRSPAPADRSVSVVVPTNREHQIDNVLANVGRQAHRDLELILVLHGLGLDHAGLRARAAEQGIDRLQVIDADPSVALGGLMNLGVDAAGGRYTAKMDDDNYYGRHYLADLVNAFAGTDAGIVGKWAHYVWLRASDAVVLRYENFQNRYHQWVQGGSIVVESALAKDLRFSEIPRAVDTDFLNRAWADGVRTYSADRFNFVSVREADRDRHTWKVTDAEMMAAGARVCFYGDPRPQVDA